MRGSIIKIVLGTNLLTISTNGLYIAARATANEDNIITTKDLIVLLTRSTETRSQKLFIFILITPFYNECAFYSKLFIPIRDSFSFSITAITISKPKENFCFLINNNFSIFTNFNITAFALRALVITQLSKNQTELTVVQ